MSLFTRNVVIALFITGVIIATVIYSVSYLDHQRIVELNDIQNRLATDTLSIDTQFALLEEAPCEDLTEGTALTHELSDLGDKLAFTEEKLGATNPEVLRLKQQYTLLEIRDYLLTKRLANSCGLHPVIALYFYSNTPGSCADCDRAGYALSYLRQTYPKLRVYAFDYDLDLGALRTLVSVEKVDAQLPAFIIQGKRSYGFTTLEDLEKQFPKSLFATTTTATTKVKK
ncbi:MAG: hypothetical protein AAB472_03170 [Patescibacteria group bacterium]